MNEGRPILIVTRSEPSDDRLVSAVQEEGCEVARLALFATCPGYQVAAFTEWLTRPAPGCALAWTSRRAATLLAEAALPAHREALERLPLFAVGEESAGPITASGLSVSVPGTGLGAGHLAAHLIEHASALGIRRVAFLHGDRALSDLPDTLARAGIPVDRFEVYRTSYLAADLAPLVRALHARRPCVVAYYSPSAISGLERLMGPGDGESLHADSVALARGETTYQALLRWGYAHAQRPVGDRFPSFDAFVLHAVQSAARSPR